MAAPPAPGAWLLEVLRHMDVGPFVFELLWFSDLARLSKTSHVERARVRGQLARCLERRRGISYAFPDGKLSSKDPQLLQKLADQLNSDDGLACWFYSIRGTLPHVGTKLFGFVKSRKVLIRLMERDPRVFKYASMDLRDDPKIVRTAVEHDPSMLEIASETQRDDPELVLIAYRKCHSTLRFASARLRSDLTFMLNIVHYSLYDFMMYASEELKRSPRCISAVNAKYREQLEKEYGSRDKIPSYCANLTQELRRERAYRRHRPY